MSLDAFGKKLESYPHQRAFAKVINRRARELATKDDWSIHEHGGMRTWITEYPSETCPLGAIHYHAVGWAGSWLCGSADMYATGFVSIMQNESDDDLTDEERVLFAEACMAIVYVADKGLGYRFPPDEVEHEARKNLIMNFMLAGDAPVETASQFVSELLASELPREVTVPA